MSYRDDFREVSGNYYWTLPRVLGWMLATLVVLGIVGFLTTGVDLAQYKFWAPKFENARREVFENTKSYNQGMVQEIENMAFEYAQADDAHKEALARIILHRTADFDLNKLPPDTRAFIQQLRRGQR